MEKEINATNERISEAELANLVAWHESFPLNVNGKATLAALRELTQARAELDKALASGERVRQIADRENHRAERLTKELLKLQDQQMANTEELARAREALAEIAGYEGPDSRFDYTAAEMRRAARAALGRSHE